MGYSNGGKNFTPDDTNKVLHISGTMSYTLEDIIANAKSHFGENVQMDKVEITAEHIHTSCIGYDSYDAGDYEEFIILTKID